MSNYTVILDANVLAGACLRDTLLRMAEEPRLYRPRWSERIIEELRGVLERKLGLPRDRVDWLVAQLRENFPEAWVTGFHDLVPAMGNHPKDRHVLAAGVRCGAQAVVTFDLRDFPANALREYGIVAQSPDDFLIRQFHLAPEIVLEKLVEQAAAIERTPSEIADTLEQVVPKFVAALRAGDKHTFAPQAQPAAKRERITRKALEGGTRSGGKG